MVIEFKLGVACTVATRTSSQAWYVLGQIRCRFQAWVSIWVIMAVLMKRHAPKRDSHSGGDDSKPKGRIGGVGDGPQTVARLVFFVRSQRKRSGLFEAGSFPNNP